MTRAVLIRQRAHEAELRARALADQAEAAGIRQEQDAVWQASDAEALAARVLLELARVEEELEAA